MPQQLHHCSAARLGWTKIFWNFPGFHVVHMESGARHRKTNLFDSLRNAAEEAIPQRWMVGTNTWVFCGNWLYIYIVPKSMVCRKHFLHMSPENWQSLEVCRIPHGGQTITNTFLKWHILFSCHFLQQPIPGSVFDLHQNCTWSSQGGPVLPVHVQPFNLSFLQVYTETFG